MIEIMSNIETFKYYSGDIATGENPTEGTWQGRTFLADGKEYILDEEDQFPQDGTGVYYLYRVYTLQY